MDWSNETVLSFIDDYKKNRSLWDTRVPDYKNMFVKKIGLMKLAKEYNCDVGHVKRKIKSLRTAFRREVSKMLSRREIDGGDATPKWFAYRPMSFLLENDNHTDLETYNIDSNPYGQDKLNDGDKFKIVENNHRVLETYKVEGDVKKELYPQKRYENQANVDHSGNDESQDSFLHDSNTTSPITVNSQKIDSRSSSLPVKKREKFLKIRKTKPIKRIRKNVNKNILDTYKLFNLKSNKIKDEFDYFTKSIATRIRNLNSKKAKSYVQYAIGKILYDAEMGRFDNPPCNEEKKESCNELIDGLTVDENIIKIEPEDE